MKTIMALILVAYIVSPVDFLPDALPFVGTLDDATAGAIVAALLAPKKNSNRRR